LKSLKGKRTKPLTGVGRFRRGVAPPRRGSRRNWPGSSGGVAGPRSAAPDRVPAWDRACFEGGRVQGTPSASFAAFAETYRFPDGRRHAVSVRGGIALVGVRGGAGRSAGPRRRSSEKSAAGAVGLGFSVPLVPFVAGETASSDPKDSELSMSRMKPEETLVEVRSGYDVQIYRLTCV